jgi:hypothetical protein
MISPTSTSADRSMANAMAWATASGGTRWSGSQPKGVTRDVRRGIGVRDGPWSQGESYVGDYHYFGEPGVTVVR